jgi:hypothetical protein
VETNQKDQGIKTIQKIDQRYQFACTAKFFAKEYNLLHKALMG